MNKKEVSEIKKQFTPETNVFTDICGCFVDADKNIKVCDKKSFYTLPKEDMFKYLDIAKKSITGKIGKNLFNLEFPLESGKDGGVQELLYKLRECQLGNEELVKELYKKIADTYYCDMNYYIMLLNGVYDVPGKAADETIIDDGSEEEYSYILCCICPVNLSKAGLEYIPDINAVEDCKRSWLVEKPKTAFLFPAFNDRSADIHASLYFSKKPDETQDEFITEMFGTKAPTPAEYQKDTFKEIVESVLDHNCDYETVKAIHENINEMIEDNKNSSETLVFNKDDIERIFEKSEVPNECLEDFSVKFNKIAEEDMEFVAENISDIKKFALDTPEISLKVNADYMEMLETRIVDGKECIVIPVGSKVLINGIDSKTIARK